MRIDAGQVCHRISRLLTGACIEDVNHEIYGGIYSQMIFGESFGEQAMELEPDEPAFAGLSGQVSCLAPRSELQQASEVRSWQPFRTGTARGLFAVEPDSPVDGRQSQRLTFAGGTGAVGIENRGLNRWGMCFRAGKLYEGYLWVRRDAASGPEGASAGPLTVQVALEDGAGARQYAQASLAVVQPEWQRLDFALIPDRSDAKGRFSITLTQPGTLVLGHAFLQPGPWGRFKGLPVRKDVVDELIDQGLTVLRYGGSMVNGADEYRWKKMIGPRDRRPPYRGFWYPHSSNGWGIVDFIDLCEAAGFACVPCFNTGESATDMADFVDYVNGPSDSDWGRRRAAAGHPDPYRLKYLELGNEQHVDQEYYERFVLLADAIWTRDPGITIIVGMHWDLKASIDQHAEYYRKVLEFARTRNQVVWFDAHVGNHEPHEPDLRGFRHLAEQLAGFGMDNYRICVLEENANNHGVRRALGHAHAINLFQRSGFDIPILCAANCLQPCGQNDNGWNQGLLFLAPAQTWLQPPGYVTQMVSRNYLPLCVAARVDCPELTLDVTATRSEDGRILVLQVLNMAARAVTARIAIEGLAPSEPAAQAFELAGPLEAVNTPDEPDRIVPRQRPWTHGLGQGPAVRTFAPHSFTILRLR
jgi:alpha-L-arabinofuranosidase